METTTRTKDRSNGNRKVGRMLGLTDNQFAQLVDHVSTQAMRGAFLSYLGQQYGTNRDVFTALGYIKSPTYEHYLTRYRRQDIARAIIDAPVRACWRQQPDIVEAEAEPTEFETKWLEIVKKRSVYHYLSRCDRMACLGHYAVLLLGFDDGKEFVQPVVKARELKYIMPYDETAATVRVYETDTKNERFGLPLIYSIGMTTGDRISSTATLAYEVHYSRVIHVTHDNLESDVVGTPMLESVLNRLFDLEKIAGSSAEAFWREVISTILFKIDKDMQMQPGAETVLEDQVEDLVHRLRNYMLLKGIDAQKLQQQIADPSPHIQAQVSLIAAATRIPQRILLGSERGELASGQDEKNWAQRVEERRVDHCEAKLLRPLIDRLIQVGVLPAPKKEYTVKWPDILSVSSKEKAEVGELVARALNQYLMAGAETLLPRDVFLRDVLHFSQEQVDKINAGLEEQQGEPTGVNG